jgi:hypothetical protein
MRRPLMLAVCSALASLSAASSPAQSANGSLWDHNGSKMTWQEDGEKRKFVYTEPKEGLDKAGIRPGTVLFEGKRKPDGRLAGMAKIFRGGCNPVDYFVEGTYEQRKGQIVLQGQAPVYGEKGCEVSGYSDSSPASTLSFSYLGEAPALAERRPEPNEIEQGDGGADDSAAYLPPSSRQGFARRKEEPEARLPRSGDQADEEPLSRRASPYRRYEDEDRYPDYWTSPERRYSRGPDYYEERERAERRRRLQRLLEPDYEDEEIYEDYAPPYRSYWRRRLY